MVTVVEAVVAVELCTVQAQHVQALKVVALTLVVDLAQALGTNPVVELSSLIQEANLVGAVVVVGVMAHQLPDLLIAEDSHCHLVVQVHTLSQDMSYLEALLLVAYSLVEVKEETHGLVMEDQEFLGQGVSHQAVQGLGEAK